MEEINLVELFRFFLKKIYIIIIAVVVFLGIGIIYTYYYQTPLYKSQTTLLLLKASNSNTSYLSQSDLLMNQNLITTYSEIIKSNKVLSRTIEEAKLSKTTSELNSMISVSSQKSSIIIAINVSSESKEEAQKIASSLAKVFSEEVKNLMNMENVGIVDTATLPSGAYNVQPVKQIGISIFAGLFLSISLLFVIYYFDTTIKSEDQIEKEISLSVIGIVPEKKRGSRWKKN